MPSALEREFVSGCKPLVVELRKVSKNKTDKPIVIKIKIGISFFITTFSILNGTIKTAKPKITNIFEMLLPITFPNSISAFPAKCELKEIANSGADVPNATIVKPITAVGIFKFLAKDAEPSTKKSAHLISNTNPTTDKIMFKAKAKNFPP